MVCDFCKRYERLKKLDAKMAPKMDVKSILGIFFVILGGLWRSPIFHKFLVGMEQRSGKMRSWRQKGATPDDFGSAQRNARGQRWTIGGSRAEDFNED